MTDNVVFLFDESGNAGQPWAKAGFHVFCFDLENDGKPDIVFPSGGRITFMAADLYEKRWVAFIQRLRPVFIGGFPPCTDLAVSGSRHFARKLLLNRNYRKEAMQLVMLVPAIANACRAPFFLENPVSVISSQWRKPDHIFHPWEYGGYLPKGDRHPRWPKYIAPRDAYPKKTCLWVGNGFVMPKRRPVPIVEGYSDQYKKLGGKSWKTKQIRSETPRGFALAVFDANAPL